jgi:hypothetical protein
MGLVYTAGLLTAVDGSFGLNGIMYPRLYRWLSPFRGLRSPARFGAIVCLPLAILGGFGARRLLNWCRTPMLQHVALFAMIAAVLIDAWPALKLVPVWKDPPPIYASLRNQPGVVLAEFPVRSDAAFNTAFMYFSIWHWLPMVNGYSGFTPRHYAEAWPLLEEFPLGKSVDLVQRLGVTHVTVNCGLGWVGIEDCETIMRRIAMTPELQPVSQVQWEGGRVALYRLTRRPPQ